MENLLKKQNFVHDNEDVYDKFRWSLNELTGDDEGVAKRGVQDIFRTLDVLGDKLTSSKKPQYETKGWEMAQYVFTEIRYLAGRFANKSPPGEMEKQFYTFIVCLLENSLTLLHIQIAQECLNDSDLKVKDHIQKFDKTSLISLLSVVCKPIKMDEAKSDCDYGNVYYRFICLLLQEVLTEKQVKDSHSSLLDYTVYCYLESINLVEEVYSQLADTGEMVLKLFDDPFTMCQSEKIQIYIKKITTVVQSKTFAPNETVAKSVVRFLEKMMRELGKLGKLEELYNELFDLVMVISKCTFTLEGDKYVLDLFFGARAYFSEFETKTPSKNAVVFENIVQKFIKAIQELDIKFLNHYGFAYTVVDNTLLKLYGNNKQLSSSWVKMLVPLLQKPCKSTIRACTSITGESKGINWKEHPEIIRLVFELFQSFQPPTPTAISEMEEEMQEEIKDYFQYFKRTVSYFLEGLGKDKLIKSYGKVMMELTLKFMNTEHTDLHELAESIAENTELNAKEDKTAIIEAMKKFHQLIKNDNLPWSSCWPLRRAGNDFIDSAFKPFKDGKLFSDDDFKVLVSICITCLQYDCLDPEEGTFPSAHFSMFSSVVKYLFDWLEAINKMDIAAPLVPELVKCLDVDDENVVTLIGVYFMLFARAPSGIQFAAPYLEKLIIVYLEQENQNFLMAIIEMYPSNPKALRGHFRALLKQLEESGNPSLVNYLALLFQKVSKIQAELFTSEDISMLIKKAKENTNSELVLVMILQELSKRCPEKVIKQMKELSNKTGWSSNANYYLNDVKMTLALYKKEIAYKVLVELFQDLKTSQGKDVILMSFNSIRLIGFKYPELLKEKRKEVENFPTTDPDIKTHQKLILDMIDGKTPEDMINQLKRQEEDLANLVGRVDETESILIEVKGEVTKQGEQLDNVKNEVQEQGKKLENVENKVDETIVKVEEIDKKTLSHAPFWARDISKFLNPKSDHDWRLLSSRLGYKNEDIRGWSQQADPCMAMLNEWYVTHKTSEATLAVLTQLQEMDRLDAAAIVENAMKNAEAVVEDEEFVYASPPPIFISYQWSHQAEVKLLKQHLEMAGYECWLDIGQMGGGDKLFEKIDTGIRAAKVVISCVTSKYAKSPNCNREVNLAVSLNKPIIPLLLEQCPWPPPGSMGPIFSEYLFIRFFQRTGEEMPDQRYWAKEKFQELLMQLNVVGLSPEEVKVQPEYKNWWIPVIQEIKIDKSKTKNGGAVIDVVQSDLDKIASESPDIFISYQWGKQKNILKLYERLSSLGFSCWLDIKQMGGGDSLYDKIDKGIRGCKVVLSCVTQKYSLSANCRREVSLTDALKKPMIPLLLEKINWPPSGPMSMVMTQLVYINFFKDESIQMTWEGPEFEELLHQIRQHVPNKQLASENNSKKSSPGNDSKNIKKTSPVVQTEKKIVLSPSSTLVKPQRKISQPTKPSLAPIKQQYSANQTLSSPIISPPSTASLQPKTEPIKKTQIRKQSTLLLQATASKPSTSATTTKPPQATQNGVSKNNPVSNLPPPKQILKPISSAATAATPFDNPNLKSKPPPKTQPSRNIMQQSTGRPPKLPPLEQKKRIKTSDTA